MQLKLLHLGVETQVQPFAGFSQAKVEVVLQLQVVVVVLLVLVQLQLFCLLLSFTQSV
jgi:hypothetical protein